MGAAELRLGRGGMGRGGRGPRVFMIKRSIFRQESQYQGIHASYTPASLRPVLSRPPDSIKSTNRPSNNHPSLLLRPLSRLSPLYLNLLLLLINASPNTCPSARTGPSPDGQGQYLSHQSGKPTECGAHVEGEEGAELG